MPEKKKIFALLLGICAVVADIAALVLIREDDAGLLYFILFPLTGVLGMLACRAGKMHPAWGLGIPVLVLFVFLPFSFEMKSWWFLGGGVVFYFGVFFALLILAGWLIAFLPAMMAGKQAGETKNDRLTRRIRLVILLAIVVFLLLALWNLAFGNPVTAMTAGEQMRDWIAEQAEAGVVYEIKGGHLPKYSWYGTEYVFDLAGEGTRWVLHWNDGKIRLDSEGW